MNFFRNKPLVITIIILVVLTLFMALTSNSGEVTKVASAVAGPFVPAQGFFYNISESAGDFFDRAFNMGSSSEEIKRLQEEVEALKLEYAGYNELKAENKRLSEMLDYTQNNETTEFKVANIIGKEPGNWFSTFTINLGYNDGIRENMAVITPNGLVGRVSQTGISSSKVIAIIDGRSGVASVVERTRDIGVIKGAVGNDDANALLSMNFLPLDTDIVEDDRVLSSGHDGIFPKGVLIGTVVGTKDGKSSKNITIKPAVDFTKLEEVLVVIPINAAEPISQSSGSKAASANVIDDGTQNQSGSTLTSEGVMASQEPQEDANTVSPSPSQAQTSPSPSASQTDQPAVSGEPSTNSQEQGAEN